MRHARAVLILFVGVATLTSSGAGPATKPAEKPEYVSPWAFIKDYRVQHYLEAAVEIQQLAPEQRTARLRAIAADPKRRSELFPLCRMLFEAKPGEEFRRPLIGAPFFQDAGDTSDWPLEPITIFEGLPILVVGGYGLAGLAEPAARYLEYCLEECSWRESKYEPVPLAKRKEVIEKFLATHRKFDRSADWVRRQAE